MDLRKFPKWESLHQGLRFWDNNLLDLLILKNDMFLSLSCLRGKLSYTN